MQKYPPAQAPLAITPTLLTPMIDYQLRTRLVAGEHAIEQLGRKRIEQSAVDKEEMVQGAIRNFSVEVNQ